LHDNRSYRSAVVLGAWEGRTTEALDIMGEETLAKLTSADTNGAAAIIHQKIPPMSGPPLHRHSREDEWFYILEGELTFEVDGQRTIVRSGGSAFVLRGTAHTFRNFGADSVKILVMVMPGAFQRFLEELSLLTKGQPGPDLGRVERLMNNYGIELLGPAISMTTQSVASESFALAAEEGRTRQPLNILGGASTLAKLTKDDTDGTIAIFR